MPGFDKLSLNMGKFKADFVKTEESFKLRKKVLLNNIRKKFNI